MDMGQQSVLVIDDDASLAENVSDILKFALDVQVAIAPGSSEGLAMAGRQAFDLALVDVRLPDGDGTGLIPELRRLLPLAEVFLITGDATVESAIAAVRGGAFA
jgi:DNA-binding NtrC family response regulator